MDLSGSQMTIATWVFFNTLSSGIDQRIISKASGSAETDHYWMLGTTESSGHVVRARIKAGGSTITVIAGSGSLATGTWYHIAVTYDGSFVRLYLDGTNVGQSAKTGVLGTNSGVSVNIGRNPNASGYFSGRIDEARIYSLALTAAEIAYLAQP